MAEFTISTPEAQTRITAWQTDQSNIQQALITQTNLNNLPCLTINAFTFELSDITDLLARINTYNIDIKIGENPINAIRFYIGKKNPDLPEVPYACLIGVGVSNFFPANNNGGEDILTLPPTPNSSGIYDFSFPCPSTCAEAGQSIMDHS